MQIDNFDFYWKVFQNKSTSSQMQRILGHFELFYPTQSFLVATCYCDCYDSDRHHSQLIFVINLIVSKDFVAMYVNKVICRIFRLNE